MITQRVAKTVVVKQYQEVTLEPTEAMVHKFVALVNRLPRDFRIISARSVKPIVRSTTERYLGIRRDRGNFTQYVYAMFAKETDIPETWKVLKPKGICTAEKPCNDCCHCAMIACADIAQQNGLIAVVNHTGSKYSVEGGKGYTKYYRLDEHSGVDMNVLDEILASV